MFITKYNEHELDEIYEYYKQSHVDNILFVPMYTNKDDVNARKEWLPQAHYYQAYMTEVFCSELWNYPVINFTGKLLPCCSVYDYKETFGALANSSFRDIWNSEQYQDARNIFAKERHTRQNGKNNICVRCKGILKTSSDLQ